MAKEEIANKDIVTELRDMEEENDMKHLEPVNIVIGRYQPFTIGHLGMAKELEKENELPSVYVYVRSKSGKNKKFSDKLTTNFMEDVVQQEELVKDAFPMESAFIPVIIKEAQRRGYHPVLIGAGSDRANSYKSMVKRMTDVTTHPDFSIQELKGRLTSATEVRKVISNDDEKKFKKLTPKPMHQYYAQLKEELEKDLALTETINVAHVMDSLDIDIDTAEEMLESHGEDFFSNPLIIESIIKHELNKIEENMEKSELAICVGYEMNQDSWDEVMKSINKYVGDLKLSENTFIKPSVGKTLNQNVNLLDENGDVTKELNVSIYNRGTEDMAYELVMYTSGIRRGLNESESTEENVALVSENISKIHNEALVKAHSRIFERIIAFKKLELNLDVLEKRETELFTFMSKVEESKLEAFKNALNERLDPATSAKVDAAIEVMVKSNRPIVWETFRSEMIRSEFFKKEFRPFLMMQGLSDFQIDRFVDNLLRVKYQHYTNYYLGNPGLQYVINK